MIHGVWIIKYRKVLKSVTYFAVSLNFCTIHNLEGWNHTMWKSWHLLDFATTNASGQTDLFGPCLISSTSFSFYPAVCIDDPCWTVFVCYALSITTLTSHLTLYCVKELYADCTTVRNHIVFIVEFDMMNNWACAHNLYHLLICMNCN